MRSRVPAFVLAVGVVALPAAGDVASIVLDERGEPLAGARVCYLQGQVEIDCTTSDANGAFRLVDNPLNVIRVLAEGCLPRTMSPGQVAGPIRLQRSPSLVVRLYSRGSRRPVGRGQIFVVYPDGKRKGPFPVNEAGVRIDRLLDPGTVIIESEAVGYESPVTPAPATLAPGRLTTVEIELAPQSAGSRPGS